MTGLQLGIALLALLLPPGAAASVRARFLYEDRVFAATGWTGELRLRPIVGARAVLESETGQVLSSGTTDASGEVEFTQNLLDGMRFRVSVEARDTALHLRVVRSNGLLYTLVSDLEVYSATASSVIEVIAPYKLDGQRSVGGAFNIFDVIWRGMEKLVRDFGAAGFPLLTIQWEVGATSPRTSCFSGLRTIYLLGGSDDTDEYDDAIIAHEFGHYLADVFSRDDSRGGTHYLNHEYPLSLSWSEGMAHYLSSLLRENPLHFDSYGDHDYLSFNLETVHVGTPAVAEASIPPGAACEMRVAAALWDVTDGTADDPEAAPESDFWTVFHDDLPSAPYPVTMESYFLSWRARWATREDWTSFVDALAGQGVLYYGDALEPNNAEGKASLIAQRAKSGPLTLFDTGDEDWFTVPVTTGTRYIFETDALHNGADTMLVVLDATGGTVLAQNDNSGRTDSLGQTLGNSRILWKSDRTGIVLLRVRPVTGYWQAHFGSYELVATLSPDQSGDGRVDTVDLLPWAGHMPDFNLDGVRNYIDWFDFAGRWSP